MMCTHVDTCMFTHSPDVYMRILVYIYICMCTYVHAYSFIACIYLYIHDCMYERIDMYINVKACVTWIYMYMHVCIHPPWEIRKSHLSQRYSSFLFLMARKSCKNPPSEIFIVLLNFLLAWALCTHTQNSTNLPNVDKFVRVLKHLPNFDKFVEIRQHPQNIDKIVKIWQFC